MAEEAPAAAGQSKPPVRDKKEPATKRTRSSRSIIPKMILEVMAESKQPKGTSVAAIKKALAGKGMEVTKLNNRINASLARLVADGALTQVKGSGASGSFKLSKVKADAKPNTPKKKKNGDLKLIQKVPKPKRPASSPKKKGSQTVIKKYAKVDKKSKAKKSETSGSPRKTPATAKPKPKQKQKPTMKEAKPLKKVAGKKGKVTKKETGRKVGK